MQVDTLAVVTEITNTVGAEVSALVSLVLGAVIKVVVDLSKKASAHLNNAPAAVKALVVVLFGQAAAFLSAKTGVFINPDIAALDTTLVGILLTGVSMGVHGFTKSVITPVKNKFVK